MTCKPADVMHMRSCIVLQHPVPGVTIRLKLNARQIKWHSRGDLPTSCRSDARISKCRIECTQKGHILSKSQHACLVARKASQGWVVKVQIYRYLRHRTAAMCAKHRSWMEVGNPRPHQRRFWRYRISGGSLRGLGLTCIPQSIEALGSELLH